MDADVIDAAIDNDEAKVVALSTDNASCSINLYRAIKVVSDKLPIVANN